MMRVLFARIFPSTSIEEHHHDTTISVGVLNSALQRVFPDFWGGEPPDRDTAKSILMLVGSESAILGTRDHGQGESGAFHVLPQMRAPQGQCRISLHVSSAGSVYQQRFGATS